MSHIEQQISEAESYLLTLGIKREAMEKALHHLGVASCTLRDAWMTTTADDLDSEIRQLQTFRDDLIERIEENKRRLKRLRVGEGWHPSQRGYCKRIEDENGYKIWIYIRRNEGESWLGQRAKEWLIHNAGGDVLDVALSFADAKKRAAEAVNRKGSDDPPDN